MIVQNVSIVGTIALLIESLGDAQGGYILAAARGASSRASLTFDAPPLATRERARAPVHAFWRQLSSQAPAVPAPGLG